MYLRINQHTMSATVDKNSPVAPGETVANSFNRYSAPSEAIHGSVLIPDCTYGSATHPPSTLEHININ